MKIIKILFIAVLTLFIGILLLKTNTTKGAVSEIDNRTLTDFKYTSFSSLDEGFTRTIDAYFKDRLGFRNEMINFYTAFNDIFFHEMIHPLYEYGKKDHVFFKMKKEDVDENFVAEFCSYIKKVQDYCEERDVPFIFCLNPSKPMVYNDFLPKGYIYKNQFYEIVLEYLNQQNINYIDNVETLKGYSKTIQIFNKKYDAGHWNDFGAFYGTNNFLVEISKSFPGVQPHQFNDFTIDTIVEQNLSVSKFIINEKVPRFSLKDNNTKITTSDYKGIEVDSRHAAFISFETDKKDLPTLLFFHGSYYNTRTDYYLDRFRHAIGVHNYQNFLNFDYYFNIFKPDCVVFETTDYVFNTGYYDLEAMKSKKLNPIYQSVKDKSYTTLKLSDLKNYTEDPFEDSKLMKITFDVDDNIDFGYLFSNGIEYDLSIENFKASLTLLKNDYKPETVKIILF